MILNSFDANEVFPIKQHAYFFKKDIRDKFIEALYTCHIFCESDVKKEKRLQSSEAVNAFRWDDSKEGENFWRTICYNPKQEMKYNKKHL